MHDQVAKLRHDMFGDFSIEQLQSQKPIQLLVLFYKGHKTQRFADLIQLCAVGSTEQTCLVSRGLYSGCSVGTLKLDRER